MLGGKDSRSCQTISGLIVSVRQHRRGIHLVVQPVASAASKKIAIGTALLASFRAKRHFSRGRLLNRRQQSRRFQALRPDPTLYSSHNRREGVARSITGLFGWLAVCRFFCSLCLRVFSINRCFFESSGLAFSRSSGGCRAARRRSGPFGLLHFFFYASDICRHDLGIRPG